MKPAKILFGSVFLSALVTLAADPKPAHPTPTPPAAAQAQPSATSAAPGMMKAPSKEDRAKMAGIHEKMAMCLKSEAPIETCHKEMIKNCEDAHGKGKCPMMGMGMGPGEMGHGGPGGMMAPGHGGPGGMMAPGHGGPGGMMMHPGMMGGPGGMMKPTPDKTKAEKK